MNFSQWGKEPEHTGYDIDALRNIGKSTVHVPEGFNVHSRIERMFMKPRQKAIDANKIDWATAEAMALGSLSFEGYNARLVGEDSERGTFSQRHTVLHDQEDAHKTMPLLDAPFMREHSKGRIQVKNTNLAELGPMAYEYGYSLENPKNLCIWEAQFGDFYQPA